MARVDFAFVYDDRGEFVGEGVGGGVDVIVRLYGGRGFRALRI